MKSLLNKLLLSGACLACGASYAMLPTPPAQMLPNLSGWGLSTSTNTVQNTTQNLTDTSLEVAKLSSPVLQSPLPNPPLLGVQPAQAPTHFVKSSNDKLQMAVFAFLVQGDTLVPISEGVAIQPNDVVEYQAYVTNNTGERVRSATIALHIPAGVQLLGAISPAGYFVSTDGVNFGRATANAPQSVLDNYKALLWNVQDMGIDGVAMVKYRAKIQ